MSLIGKLARPRNASGKPPIPLDNGRAMRRGLMYNLGAGRQDGETFMRQYGMSGTLYGIVSLLAESAATPEWHLYRKQPVDGRRRYSTGDQGSDQRIEVVQHAAISLWNSPNDWHSGFEFREGAQQHEELTGETMWVLDVEAGFPTSMWYVRPDRMEPVPDKDKFLTGWIYTAATGEQIPLKANEVIQEKRPDPLDPYRGAGPVASILPNIQQQRYATEYQRNLFLNGADPGGVITVPSTLTEPQFDELVDRWRESHRGVARAGQIGVLENGAQWTANAHSNKDMEYGQLRLANRDELREAWRIHKAMMGTSDDVNRANAQTAQEVFVAWQVIPRLNRRRDTLNSKLLPLFGSTGKGVEMDYDDPSPVNAETAANELLQKAQAAQALLSTNQFNPRDVLEAVGLPDMELADLPAAATPLPTVPDATPAQNRERIAIYAAAPPPPAPPAQPQQPTQQQVQQIDAQWKAAVALLVAAWLAHVLPSWNKTLIKQVRERIAAGNLPGLAALSIPADDIAAAAETILAHTEPFAQAAAKQAASEAAERGAGVVTPHTPSHAELAAAARTSAQLQAQQAALTAGREASRLAGPEADAEDVAKQVGEFLDGLSDAGPTAAASQVMSAAQNQSRIATIAAGPRAQIVATEIHDNNTCLAPETTVTTRRGSVRAEEVRLSDSLLTHSGRWVKPSRIVVSRVNEDLVVLRLRGGVQLRVTADHPLLVHEGGDVVWRSAGQIAPGTLVVAQESVEGGRELGVPDLVLGEAPNGIAAPFEVSSLAAVNMRAQRVPVVAVRLDDEKVANEEVNDPRPDRRLDAEPQRRGLQTFARPTLNARLQSAGDVAGCGAVATSTALGRCRSEFGAALLAGHQHRRSPARFAAVAPVLGATEAECRTATPASAVTPASHRGALLGAVGVAARGGDGDVEVLSAVGASLRRAPQRRSELGSQFGISELTCLRAVNRAVAGSSADFMPADLAELPDGLIAAPLPGGTGLAPSGLRSNSRSAVNTRLIHVFSVQETAREPYCGDVYDFTIPGDRTFFAEGVLVHNCDPCDKIDGRVFGYSDDPEAVAAATAAYPAGGYVLCEGGPRCRGTVFGVYGGTAAANRAPAPVRAAKDAAAKAFAQEAEDFPPAATAWMHHADWSGPVNVPLAHIDWTPGGMEGNDPDKVAAFVARLQAGKKLKPVLLVKTPGSDQLQLVDGHHRFLAAAELKAPVRAFIGVVDADHGPWESMHDHQYSGTSDISNQAANTPALRLNHAEPLRRTLINGYAPVELAGRH